MLTIVTRKSWHIRRDPFIFVSVIRFPEPAEDFVLKIVRGGAGKIILDAGGQEISFGKRTYL